MIGATRLLHRLYSIKSRILVFALLATLIPSLTMGWLSYRQTKRFLADKIAQELRDATQHVARELDLWLKERLYEVKVFASSYVVSESLEKRTADGVRSDPQAIRRLTDYLKAVQTKFTEYQELLVVDPTGTVVATSLDRPSKVRLPENWLGKSRSGEHLVGVAHLDDTLRSSVIVVAEPILAADQRVLGVLAAKVGLRGVDGLLREYSAQNLGELYLLAADGAVIASTTRDKAGAGAARLAPEIAARLFAQEQAVQEFRDRRGVDVIGTLKTVASLSLGVAADVERARAYAQVYRLQELTIAFVCALLVGIGVVAYLLGLTIVRPLDRLVGGAATVALGDLDVDLPLPSRGELGYLTEVFNHMVQRLREGRRQVDEINQTLRDRNLELQQLSITDSLTGLHNRKHLMELLALELARTDRYGTPLSVLMIDIDNFKRYNDTFGHLAGDEVLRRLAATFRGSVRPTDIVGRFGGEEFVIALPDTQTAGAIQTAERIRAAVEAETFGSAQTVAITLSVGVTVTGDGPLDLTATLQRADTALYRAKQSGRNRVVDFADASPGAT